MHFVAVLHADNRSIIEPISVSTKYDFIFFIFRSGGHTGLMQQYVTTMIAAARVVTAQPEQT
jgi:hypothetical protein